LRVICPIPRAAK